MARPHGFDHFCNYLKGLEAHYVIIGGGAASILLDDEGLEFRITKDVDLVILTRSKELNERMLTYIKVGGYKTKEASDGSPRYYRFKAPDDKDCPAMIEIFARNEFSLEIQEGQYVIPLKENSSEQLSAILLDDEYFDLIKRNLTTSESGIPLINAVANICLKARAHRELSARRQAGDNTAEEKAIQKHLKDIWRLGATLKGKENSALTGAPATDVANALTKLDAMSEDQCKQIMENIPGANMKIIMGFLKTVFPS